MKTVARNIISCLLSPAFLSSDFALFLHDLLFVGICENVALWALDPSER